MIILQRKSKLNLIKYVKTTLLVLSILAVNSVNAVVITFDFSGNSGRENDSITAFSNGYSLTATGFIWDINSSQYMQSTVDVFHSSLGVNGGAGKGDGRVESDIIGQSDLLLFTLNSSFDRPAQFIGLDVVFLNKWASELQVGEIASIEAYLNNASVESWQLDGPGAGKVYNHSLFHWANSFAFTAGAASTDNGFRVKNIAIDVTAPSTLVVFAIGILGCALRLMRRRKRCY